MSKLLTVDEWSARYKVQLIKKGVPERHAAPMSRMEGANLTLEEVVVECPNPEETADVDAEYYHDPQDGTVRED